MGKPGRKVAKKAGGKAKGILAFNPEKETTAVELSTLDTDELIVATKDLAAGYNAPQPPAKKQKKATQLVPTTKVIPVPESLLVTNTRNANLPSRPAGLRKTSVPVIAPITQPSEADSKEAEEDEENEEEEEVVEEAAKDTHHGQVGDCAKDTKPDKKASRAALLAKLSKDQKDLLMVYIGAHMHKEFPFRALCNIKAGQQIRELCGERNAVFKGALKCSIKEYMKDAFNRFRSAQMRQLHKKMVLARELDPVHFSQAEFMESLGLSREGVFPCDTVQSRNARQADHSKKKRKAGSESL